MIFRTFHTSSEGAIARFGGVLLLTTLLAGCDNESASRDRAAMQEQQRQEVELLAKQKILLEIKELDIERSGLAQNLLGHTSMIASLEERLSQQSAELESYKGEVEAFMMDHKMAIAAVAVTGGSAAVALNEGGEFSEEGKAIAGIVGILAAGYALFHADEVAAVADRVLQAVARTKNMDSAITATTDQLNVERAAAEEARARLEALNARIAQLRTTL